jgi:hypothetical protein
LNYTCHTLLPEGQILICTELGEIIYLENTGEYKMILPDSPGKNLNIVNILSFSKGFVLSGENGQIIVYEKNEEVKNPFV